MSPFFYVEPLTAVYFAAITKCGICQRHRNSGVVCSTASATKNYKKISIMILWGGYYGII